jgi:hypothetical protein
LNGKKNNKDDKKTKINFHRKTEAARFYAILTPVKPGFLFKFNNRNKASLENEVSMMNLYSTEDLPKDTITEFFTKHWGSPLMVISSGVYVQQIAGCCSGK